MKLYLKSIVKQLRKFSTTLDKTSILIDKPWALIDDEMEMQKLIFKKNKELILSKNGQVQIGKWDYFSEARSLLIDRQNDMLLCNEAFIDQGIMILKVDGTENKFFILANENVVPDLDVNGYLKKIRYQKLFILEKILQDGRILEIQRENEWLPPQIGNMVTIEAESVEDGKYELFSQNNYFEIKKGRIHKILTEIKYIINTGEEILIQQHDNWKISYGDYVIENGRQIDDELIDFSKRKNLVVRQNRVVRLEYKNELLRRISKIWVKYYGYYHD